jgi:hypothetical protein
MVSDHGDAVADAQAGKHRALKKGVVPDIGDAIGDGYAVNIGHRPEGIAFNAGDQEIIYRAGDGYSATSTGVPRDGDRAVVGRIAKILGSRFSNHHQQERQ